MVVTILLDLNVALRSCLGLFLEDPQYFFSLPQPIIYIDLILPKLLNSYMVVGFLGHLLSFKLKCTVIFVYNDNNG